MFKKNCLFGKKIKIKNKHLITYFKRQTKQPVHWNQKPFVRNTKRHSLPKKVCVPATPCTWCIATIHQPWMSASMLKWNMHSLTHVAAYVSGAHIACTRKVKSRSWLCVWLCSIFNSFHILTFSFSFTFSSLFYLRHAQTHAQTHTAQTSASGCSLFRSIKSTLAISLVNLL